MGFATATAVSSDGPGSWKAEIVDGWDIGSRANGGYMLAIVARAMASDLDRPDPVTITAHYLAPGPAGPVRVTSRLAASRRPMSASSPVLPTKLSIGRDSAVETEPSSRWSAVS